MLADSLVSLITGAAPPGVMMSGIGALALVANLTSLMLLVRYRQGDANIRSAWLCTRNDVLANISVIVAGLLVLASGSHWPDVLVAMAIAGLFCHSAVSILRQADAEQRAGDASGGDCHDPAR